MGIAGPAIATSRTPPWFPSGWGCRGRGFATAAAPPCAPVRQTVGRNVRGRVESKSGFECVPKDRTCGVLFVWPFTSPGHISL